MAGKSDKHYDKEQNDSEWDSRSLASSFFHNIFYITIRLTGQNVAYVLLFFVVTFYTLTPRINKRASYYIMHRFGKCSLLQRMRHTFLLYWNFGQMLVDRAVLGILNTFESKSATQDTNKITELHAENNGLILITGHVGCWQLGMSALSFINAPKAVVMFRDKKDIDKLSFEHKKTNSQTNRNKDNDFTIINPASPMGGAIEMVDALKRKSILCINADRTFGSNKNTVPAKFLGGTILLPISAFKLAAVMKTPIVITFSARTGASKSKFWIAGTIRVPQDVDKGETRGAKAFTPYANEFAKALENYCESHPYQFYNFFNMWQPHDR
ncbi:lysophospholipid acyltransferase family protein [Desulfovibrio gilichinskyi]|uniref:Predicted acyltransferase, LPLAT superfamily n=1 Tax=Desulfovibrio gilichinskyi TaxID=1519643 RepID=A0A1X7DSP1_9BACT|nr:lysophospholipid acyltransferase family protein [Desulfovibrio gilichinskyi]SMF20875.1 Predicted acyltransferase, LPLAT superfamily [Desulfovibrio gilichinskyi]